MADYDSKSTTKVVAAITPAVLAADNTPAAIDCLDFKSALVCTHVGVGGITFDATNKVEFKLTHCDESAGTYTAVEAADVVMPYGETLGLGGIIRSLIAAKAAADTEVHGVGYIGKKRYLKLLADFSGTHGTGTAIAASVVLGHPMHAPIPQSSFEV
ncbi:MAG: hypothetical protein NW216_07545 [Hyphomicrobium sp.]|nr:hypothetical protein [Hyphomicrobium sp.]